MSKRIAAVCALAAVASLSSARAQNTSPGHVNYQQLAAPYLDPYTNSPNASLQQWFQSHFMRMGVFSPYFDTRTSWFPNALVYINLYGIIPGTELYNTHPEWILHDQRGNRLYIPWGCSGGTCGSFAGDITNPAFRVWWIANAQNILNRGRYLGIWIDDVNTEFRVSDGWGNPVAPIDSATGLPMTWDAWRKYIGDFTTQIRQAFPDRELVHNTIWYGGPEGIRDNDPSVQKQIRSATNLNLERGIASDAGFTGGTGQWSVSAFFDYVDRVHGLGPGVTLEEYQVDSTSRQYGLASYFMISNGSDRIGDATTSPAGWWPGYSVELGTPRGPRTSSNGLFQRVFSNGIVLLGEPGMASQTVALPGTFKTIEGASVNSVQISGSHGLILIGATAPPAIEQAPVTAAAFSIVRNLSDLTPGYIFQSWGTPQKDLNIAGLPIKLNGVSYSKGLGVHAYSELHYALWGNCTAFTATVGVDDEVPVGLGSLAFQVWADGIKLYDSGLLQSGSPAGHVSVNLTGKQSLGLVVTNGIYQAPTWAVPVDHADWANARIGCTQ
jgi:hypothetical protein